MRKLKLVIEETDDTGTITTTLPLAFAMKDEMRRPVAGEKNQLKRAQKQALIDEMNKNNKSIFTQNG